MAIGNRLNLRKRLSEAQNHRCCFCGVRMEDSGPVRATLEHVIPLSKKGKDYVSNLVVSCLSCNNRRRDMPWEDFMARWILVE